VKSHIAHGPEVTHGEERDATDGARIKRRNGMITQPPNHRRAVMIVSESNDCSRN
jgi:hypothetical protein